MRLGLHGRILLLSFLFYLICLLYCYRSSTLMFAGDSSDYIRGAMLPLFSLGFFSYRPFTITLVYRLLGADPPTIVLFQILFYAGSWFFLARALMLWMRNRTMAWVSFGTVLLFSLSIELNMWNMAVLSESLSLSTTALFLAVVLVWLRKIGEGQKNAGSSRGWTAALVVTAFFWSFTRDAHPYVLLLLSAAIPFAFLFRRVRKRLGYKTATAIGLAFLSTFLVQTWFLRHSPKTPWTYPLTTDICSRILPDPEARDFFYKAGMPHSKILMEFSGRHNAYSENLLSDHPDKSKIDPVYDRWVLKEGMRTYFSYVLSHPFKALGWVWETRRHWIAPSLRGEHYGRAPTTLVYQRVARRSRLVLPLCSTGLVNGEVLLTSEITGLFFPMGFWVVPAAFLLGLLVLLAFRWRRSPVLFVPLSLFLGGLFLAVVTVIGDANEIDRHAICVAMLLRLSLLFSVLLISDAILELAPEGRLFGQGGRSRHGSEKGGTGIGASPAIAVLVSAAYVLLDIVAFRNSSLTFVGDALDYIQISRDPLLALRFFAYRPFTVPLMYKFFGSRPLTIVFFQVLFHAGCWLVLAFAVKSVVRHRQLRWLAFACILLLSLSIQINMWGFVILSESITNSMTALLIGVALIFGKRLSSDTSPTGPRLLAWSLGLIALAGLWSFTRDSNPYVLLFLAALIPVLFFSKPIRSALPWAVAAALVLSFAGLYCLQSWLVSKSTRKPWVYPTTNNICYHILPDPEAREFFYAHGMPRSKILDGFSGTTTAYMGNQRALVPDKSKIDPAFNRWVTRHGLETYALYITTHPLKALAWTWNVRHQMFSPNVLTSTFIGPFLVVYQVENKHRRLIPELCSRGLNNGSTFCTYWISDIFFPLWPWFYALAAAAAVLSLVLYLRGGPWVLLVPPVLCAVSFLQAVITNLGDCSDVGRHAITAAIMLRISFWMSLFFVADYMAAMKSRPSRSKPGAQ